MQRFGKWARFRNVVRKNSRRCVIKQWSIFAVLCKELNLSQPIWFSIVFNSLPYLYYGSVVFRICRSRITSIKIACTIELWRLTQRAFLCSCFVPSLPLFPQFITRHFTAPEFGGCSLNIIVSAMFPMYCSLWDDYILLEYEIRLYDRH
jgi:hypothetical protein